MKKLMYTGAIVLGTLGMVACESGTNKTTGSDKRVIDTDTVATEYEVEKTTVESDTTTKKETIKADKDKDKKKH
jgi:uncharacterized protein YcfL